MNTYGDISPRTAAFAIVNLLVRAQPYLVLEKFADVYVIPTNKTKTARWRRYENLPLATTALTEGVTPPGTSLTYTDYEATLAQYGDYVPLTDIIMDTHEDPVFSECQDLVSEQYAKTVEAIRYGIFKAGTNVFYANGSARTDVNTPLTLTLQRKIIRGLKRQNASPISKVTGTSPNYNTVPVEAAYVALAHTDCETDIRGMNGFIPVSKYARPPVSEYEIGALETTRYILTSAVGIDPWLSGGGAKGAMIANGSDTTKADVYPVLFLAQHFGGIVGLKGQNAITPMVVNPKPVAGDPLGQKGSVGWKTMQTAVILNQAFIARAEVACTEL